MENTMICQSCSMPMGKEELYGTNGDGSKNNQYCTYCFQEGTFVKPDETLEEVIATCVPFMVEDNPNLSPEEAKTQLEGILSTLDRWKRG